MARASSADADRGWTRGDASLEPTGPGTDSRGFRIPPDHAVGLAVRNPPTRCVDFIAAAARIVANSWRRRVGTAAWKADTRVAETVVNNTHRSGCVSHGAQRATRAKSEATGPLTLI